MGILSKLAPKWLKLKIMNGSVTSENSGQSLLSVLEVFQGCMIRYRFVPKNEMKLFLEVHNFTF